MQSDNSIIEPKYIRSINSKRMTISIKRGGEVIVKFPFYIPHYIAQKFFASKVAWVKTHYNRLKEYTPTLPLAERRKLFAHHKENASALVVKESARFAKLLDVHIKSISVRNQRSRWGSCSARGSLSFNYRIILLPSALSEYIIIHEVCHLKEMNHSKKFWNLVEALCPDFKSRRKELRVYAKKLL